MRNAVVAMVACLIVGAAAGAAEAYDRDGLRGYLGFRVGGQPLFTNANQSSLISLENPGAEALFGAVLGLNLTKHWGIELAGEREKTGLTDESNGRKTAEYAWYTILAQARWRYPLLDDRLTPYALAGVGVRLTQVEGKDSDSPVNFASDEAVTGSVGAGLEYFIMNNVSLGVELKYLVGANSQIRVNGQTTDLNLDAFIYMFGIRVFYPEH